MIEKSRRAGDDRSPGPARGRGMRGGAARDYQAARLPLRVDGHQLTSGEGPFGDLAAFR